MPPDHHPPLPADQLAAALVVAAGGDTDQRAAALAEDRGRREHLRSTARRSGLVSVRVTDLGPIGAFQPAVEDEEARPDVVCDRRPGEARQLAAALLDPADLADPPPAGC